jgi:tetratricopeptide (TPR) repeat protein
VSGGTRDVPDDATRTTIVTNGATDSLAAPTSDPLIKERVRRSLRERMFAIASSPVTLGRFVVLERIGSGGMATVYAAFDPQLERKVALKVIHGAGGAEGVEASDAHRERVIREAKVMARVTHPNVATVYDAAVLDGRVLIAMEYAPAGTLREWLRGERRPPATIIDAFVQAARGLVAAHDAGIVHRDFKPDNVLVADGGRMLVADFGIARDAAGGGVEGIAGTLRYMSPEQLRRDALDARTDQYSWCVALYEALYGAHPFVGETANELVQSTLAGKRRVRGAAGSAARAVLPVIERGLSPTAGDRYPRLADLLDALAQRRRRRRAVVAGAAVTGAAAVAIAGWIATRDAAAATAPCRHVATELAGVWDGARAESLRAAFAGTALPYAESTFASVRRNLDTYATSWTAMRTDACEATRVRKVESERWLAGRDQCLDARRRELDALVGVLATPDKPLLELAHDAVAKLTPVGICVDAASTPDTGPVDASVGPLDGRLDAAQAQYRAGRYKAGLALADEVVGEATSLGYDPLLARALHLRALLQSQVGAEVDAIASLYDGARVAARAGADWRAAEIAIELVYHVVYVQAQPAQLEPLRHAALAALERVGNPARLSAALDRALGTIARQGGDTAKAVDHQRAALAALDRLGPGNEAEVAVTCNNLANSYRDLGDHDAAYALYERALALQRGHLGEGHPQIAHTLNNRALVFEERAQYAEAAAGYEQARAIFEATLGPEHPHVAMTLNNLGNTLRKHGRAMDAIPLLERSLAIFTAARGEDHPHVAWPLDTLGRALVATGDLPRAHEVLARARAIRVKRLGEDSPLVAMVDTSLGIAYLAGGRAEEAIAPLEHALSVRRTNKAAPALFVETALPLARARWDVGERTSALTLAREAHALGTKLAATGDVAELDAWLAAHDR